MWLGHLCTGAEAWVSSTACCRFGERTQKRGRSNWCLRNTHSVTIGVPTACKLAPHAKGELHIDWYPEICSPGVQSPEAQRLTKSCTQTECHVCMAWRELLPQGMCDLT